MKFWLNIEVSSTNRFFGQNSKVLSKVQVLIKIDIFVKNPSFGQKSNFLSKIPVFVKNPSFCSKVDFVQKLISFVKIKLLGKNQKFQQTSIKNLAYCLLFWTLSRRWIFCIGVFLSTLSLCNQHTIILLVIPIAISVIKNQQFTTTKKSIKLAFKMEFKNQFVM